MMDWIPAITTLATTDVSMSVSTFSGCVALAAGALLIAMIIAATVTRKRWPNFKMPLFVLIVSVVTVSSTLMCTAAVYLNLNSPMGGPVQWATDYQIWACGNQLNLRGPQGLLNNRVGTATLYEKNDGRIHYDGTPTDLPTDASLGKFMQVVGGEISDSSLVVPLDSENGFVGTPNYPEQLESYISTNRSGAYARFVSDQKCGDEQAQVQAFLYQYNPLNKTYDQVKLDHPADYEISHANEAPPSDCLIVEFATPKDRTDHLCTSYGARDYERCTEFGVAADKISSCDIREIR